MRTPVIMTIGPKRGHLQALEDALGRTTLEVTHVNLASTALRLIPETAPDLVIVGYPPSDLGTEDLIRGLDQSLAELRDTKIVLFADEHHLGHLSPYLDKRHLLLSPSWPATSLKRFVFSLLPTRDERAKRLMLRLEVEMGAGPRLRLCQTDNISQSGMLVRTNDLIPVGSEVRVSITLPDHDEPVSAKAEVVRHTHPDREQIRGLGLQFMQIEGDGEAALREYLQLQDESRSAASQAS